MEVKGSSEGRDEGVAGRRGRAYGMKMHKSVMKMAYDEWHVMNGI